MNIGFTITELIVSLSITFSVLMLGIVAVSQSGNYSDKLREEQQRIESLFNMVDLIKSDLVKCGVRLKYSGDIIEPFIWEPEGFRIIYGFYEELIKQDEVAGTILLKVRGNSNLFSKGGKIIIYDTLTGANEINVIDRYTGGFIELGAPLHKNYNKGSMLVCLKVLEYKWFPHEKCLKRKIDKGFFQPLIEEITDFSVNYISEYSTLQYKVELNSKEELQSFVFLDNLVKNGKQR